METAKNSSTNEDGMNVHNDMEFRHKTKEMVPTGSVWMDLESILLSEIRQGKSHTTFMWYRDKPNQKEAHRFREETGSHQRQWQMDKNERLRRINAQLENK